MKKIQPVGQKLLVCPLPQDNHQTNGGIEIVQNVLAKAKVMEVSDEISHLYKKGDIVIHPEGSGVAQYYKQQNCLWLSHSDIWGNLIEDKKEA